MAMMMMVITIITKPLLGDTQLVGEPMRRGHRRAGVELPAHHCHHCHCHCQDHQDRHHFFGQFLTHNDGRHRLTADEGAVELELILLF